MSLRSRLLLALGVVAVRGPAGGRRGDLLGAALVPAGPGRPGPAVPPRWPDRASARAVRTARAVPAVRKVRAPATVTMAARGGSGECNLPASTPRRTSRSATSPAPCACRTAYQSEQHDASRPRLPATISGFTVEKRPGWRTDRLFHRPRRPEGRSASFGCELPSSPTVIS